MLTATTELAIRALVFLCHRGDDRPASPRQIAEAVGGSPTYMAKVAGLLTKAGIVRARYGVAGGIVLSRSPSKITLLDIVQACQGLVTANYCDALRGSISPDVCGFHQAMHDVHTVTVRTLSKWTLKRLAAQPVPVGELAGNTECRMASLAESCARCGREKRRP
jgi:Rrf2 family protein